MKLTWLIHALLGLMAACVCHAQEPRALAPSDRLDVILFPSAAAAAIYVGVDRGYYTNAGLDVRLTPTPDSPSLITGLATGRFQVAVALADNFVAYQQGQHAAPRVADHDLSIVMGLGTSNATLVARPGFPNVASLRNHIIGVDAPGTGLAFVLYRMLEDAGLTQGDYTLVPAGSTQQRSLALGRGEIDATLLTPEFAQDAQEHGLRALAGSAALLPSYMGMSVGVEKSWGAQHRATLEAFISATLAAAQWLTQPENRSAAAAILSRHLTIPQAKIEQSLSALIEGRALIVDGSIDAAGFDAVLVLRGRYGRPVRTMASTAHFVDLSYLNSARRRSEIQ
jgi:ABC-type nitrate/sulfonate/bicarbonate transport system substrate-binding protein